MLNQKILNTGMSPEISVQVMEGMTPVFEVTSQSIRFVLQSSTRYTCGSIYSRTQFIDFLNILETIPDKAHEMLENMKAVS